MLHLVTAGMSERPRSVAFGQRVEALIRSEPSLDGLRALAVLPVCLGHLYVPAIASGAFGVDMFFVLSGYLITRVLFTGYVRGRSLSVFYWHRSVRLLPVLLIVCFSIFLIPEWIFPHAQAWQDVAASLTYVSNWTLAYQRGTPIYLSHTWSLAIEEQFYLLWPLLFLAMIKRGADIARYGTLLLLLAAMIWRLTDHSYDFKRAAFGSDLHCGGLLVGCVLAQFASLRLPSWMAAIGILHYVLAVIFSFSGIYGSPAVWLATAVVINHCVSKEDSLIKRILSFKAVVYFGLISYSLYLWNFPVSNLVIQMRMSWAAQAVVGMIVSVGLASITYVFVERPCRRLRDKPPMQTITGFGRAAVGYAVVAMAAGFAFFWSDEIANAVHPTPLVVVAFGPSDITRGVSFYPQPDGTSIAWVKLSRSAPRQTKMVIGTEEVQTIILGSMVAGRVVKQTKLSAGDLQLHLVDKAGHPIVEPMTIKVR